VRGPGVTGVRVGFVLIVAALVAGVALLVTAFDAPEAPAGAARTGTAPGTGGSVPRVAVDVIRLQVPAGVTGSSSPGLEAAEAGWDALREGDNLTALADFEDAVAQGVTGVAFGMALAYRNLEHPQEALLMARQAVVERKDHADAWRLLGQLLLDDNDPRGAVEAWERAQALEPDPALEERLHTVRADAEARDRYLVGSTRHFRVRFEGPQESYLAQRILNLLEAAYAKVGLTLGYYPERVIEAVLYTQQAFFDVTRSPGWAGGIFDGTVRLPVAGAEPPAAELERVVTHEYTHAAMVQLLGPARVPVWLHEGVAMNLEGGDRSAWVAHVRRRHPAALPLSRLSDSFLGLSQGEADAAYAESYLLVRSLLDRFGPFRLADLLAACRDRPFADAFRDVYGEDPDASLARAVNDLGRAG